MKTLKRFLATVLVSGLVAAMPISVSAQPMMDGNGPGYGMGHGMMGGYGPGYGMGPGMMGPGMTWGPYSGVDLTDEQNAKIAAVQEEFSKKQWEVMSQMQDEQFKLQQLYSAPTRDNAAINEQYKKFNQLRRQMWDNMAAAQKKTDAVLTPEQRNATHSLGGRHMWGC